MFFLPLINVARSCCFCMKFILPICVAGSLSVEVRFVIYKLEELVQWISQKEIKTTFIESA